MDLLISFSDNVNVLMVLLQKVNNDILNKKNNNGKTALHLAVEHGDFLIFTYKN